MPLMRGQDKLNQVSQVKIYFRDLKMNFMTLKLRPDTSINKSK